MLISWKFGGASLSWWCLGTTFAALGGYPLPELKQPLSSPLIHYQSDVSELRLILRLNGDYLLTIIQKINKEWSLYSLHSCNMCNVCVSDVGDVHCLVIIWDALCLPCTCCFLTDKFFLVCCETLNCDSIDTAKRWNMLLIFSLDIPAYAAVHVLVIHLVF